MKANEITLYELEKYASVDIDVIDYLNLQRICEAFPHMFDSIEDLEMFYKDNPHIIVTRMANIAIADIHREKLVTVLRDSIHSLKREIKEISQERDRYRELYLELVKSDNEPFPFQNETNQRA